MSISKINMCVAYITCLHWMCSTSVVYINCFPYRSSQPVDRNSTDVAVRRNISYAATPSRSTTSGPQATVRATDQGETGPAAEYSSFGPSYEALNSRRQQPVAAVSARLSERYEFSDAHLAAAGGSGAGVQGEVAMDYEVLQNSRQNEDHDEYSHLQY